MSIITDINQLDFSQRYTYADYLTWQFQDRVELIMGKIFKMSPAPSSKHQHCISALNSALYIFLKGKPCRVFPAPFDVNIPLDSLEDTVVQPDITVVCDPTKITRTGCQGAPDLVMEVVSKTSVKRDLHEKYDLYERAAIKEYWLINPLDSSLIIFFLDDVGRYRPSKPLTSGDLAKSLVLEGFTVELDDLFITLAEEPEEGYYPNAIRI